MRKNRKKTFNAVTAKSQGRPNLVDELQQREHGGSVPWERRQPSAPRCASEPAPVAPAARPDRSAATRRALPRRAGRAQAGEEGASVAVAPRTRPCAPPPRPWWQSSVPVGRRTQRAPCRSNGATLLPGPCGWTAVRA